MEGTLTTTTTLLSFSKTLRTQLPLRPITTATNAVYERRNAGVSPVWCRRERVSSFAASSSSSGGGGVGDASPSPSDVIVLDVRGMMCGGCASSVKRILENQSQVSSASVDHTTETAIVWPVSAAKATPNWQKVIGEEIAKNLTNCGFDSNLRV